MKLIVDASVAIKWAVDEEGRAEARRLVISSHELTAPDFVLLETANVLWKKVVRRELSAAQARAAAEEVRLPFHQLVATAPYVGRALEISLEMQHPAYDCLYLAVAEATDGVVVTADSRLLAALAAGPLSRLAVRLGEVQP